MFHYQTETTQQIATRGIRSVFFWQALGMALCIGTALGIASNTFILSFVVNNSLIVMGSIFISFLLSLYVSHAAFNEYSSYPLLLASYAAYWIFDGVFLSLIFIHFTPVSIILSFGLALTLFAGMALYGYFTQSDLTSFGSLLSTSLIGMVIASLANLYFQSSLGSYLIAYIGILTFTGLVSYYTQKIKLILLSVTDNEALFKRIIIYGALYLGISLMQIFLYILRFLGRRN